ncbi:MAG: class I SAM-dependent methyltransferase [Pseudomonadota bacterium]
MSGDATTLEFYTREAKAYADYASAEKRAPLLKTFAESLRPGGDVLDFGCGSGWAAARFNQMGFRAVGWDGSAGLAEEARSRYGVDVTVGQFQEFADRAAYDGIWVSFSLLHDTREAMPGNLSRLFLALRTAGKIYIGLKEGQGVHRDKLERMYTYFTEPEMRGLMEEVGFTGFSAKVEPGRGYDGAPSNSLHIFAERP